jgi:hypothetical protein
MQLPDNDILTDGSLRTAAHAAGQGGHLNVRGSWQSICVSAVREFLRILLGSNIEKSGKGHRHPPPEVGEFSCVGATLPLL